MNDDTDVPPRSSRQNPAYRPTSDTPALHSQRIQSDARQIHTRSVAPYCCAIRALCRPIATQYGLRLRLCAHCVARIRLRYRPISRVALDTGSLSSRGCAPLTPGCILAPFQGALFPLAIFVTSAVGRCPFPLVIDLSLVWLTVQTQESRSDYQRTKGKNTGNLPSMDLWLQEDCSRTWTYKRPSSAGSRYNS